MVYEQSIGGVSVRAFSSIKQIINQEILVNGQVKPNIAIAINPEKIMSARAEPKLMTIINKATLRYADGIGVSHVLSKKLKQPVARIPGCELWELLMLASVEQQVPIYLVGATEQVVNQTRDKLVSIGVNIVGVQNGYFDKEQHELIIDDIKCSGAEIITVALGSPAQENFIFQCAERVPNAFYMGVGGTYDVFTGNVKRAPIFFQKIKCEWLFRLLSQPKRIRRQFNLIKYLYKNKKILTQQ